MSNLSHPALGIVTTVGYSVIRLLPVKVASELLAKMARRFAGYFAKERVIRRNLRAAFPDLDDPSINVLAGEITANFGRLAAEIAHIPSFKSGAGGAVLSASGDTQYALEERGKAIFVCPHLGNWELIPILFQRYDLSMTIIHTTLGHPVIDSRLMSLRRQTGATYVEKSNALRGCVAALKRNESIAFLVDQRVESGIEVDFFARPTLFTHFPARMALKFNCPIIPGEAVRRGPGHLEIVFGDPIWPGEQRGEEAERDLTQRMATAIEGSIRRYPDQWFCNKTRWKKRKKGSGIETKVS